VAPKGLRLLSRVPRLATTTAAAIAAHFGELPRLLRATADEIAAVPGVGLRTGHAVKDTLERLTESTILDQYI
jgi:diadenylate cyclase